MALRLAFGGGHAAVGGTLRNIDPVGELNLSTTGLVVVRPASKLGEAVLAGG